MAVYQKRGNAEHGNRPEPPKVAWDRVFDGKPFQGGFEGTLPRPRRVEDWTPAPHELYAPANQELTARLLEKAHSEAERAKIIAFANRERPRMWEIVTIGDGSRWWICTEALRRSHRRQYLIFPQSHSDAEAPRGLTTTAQLLGVKS